MSSVPPELRDDLAALRAHLVAHFGGRLHALILFGSWAWGRPHTASDIDVCVIIDGLERQERKHVYDLVSDVACERNKPFSPLVWSKADLQSRLAHELALAEDITQKGIAA